MRSDPPPDGLTVPTARLLDQKAGPVIELLPHRPFAWFTDVDGTLSPIAERPEKAFVPAVLHELSDRLAAMVDYFVVVSGRTPADARKLANIRKAMYIGNHGMSWLEDGAEHTLPAAEGYIPKIAQAEALLRESLLLEGLFFENKGPILAIHYRLAPDAEAARDAILIASHAISPALGLLPHEGRKVIELRPPLVHDKGVAVRNIVHRFAIRGAVYIGDDVTDVDAFRVMRSLREAGEAQTVSIAVASKEVDPLVLQEADYRVYGIEGVGRLLDRVVNVISPGEPA